ncbi:glycosyltransferase [Chryseobacterium sp. T1]
MMNKEMKPLVSITIPIYKCEDFIEKTLESVIKQTYSNIEVILVNDLTPDNSFIISKDFIKLNNLEETWSLVSLEENSGLSVVRNKGIELAKGKYIFFLDSDDEIVPDAISDFVELAEKTNSEMVVGEVEGIKLPEMTKVDVFPLITEVDVMESNPKILQALVNGSFPVSSWNKLIRLDFLKDNQLYFTKGLFAQDSLHTFEMGLKLNKIAFLRKKTYLYYLHGASVIHNRKKVHFDNWITIAQIIDQHYQKEKDSRKKELILKYLVDFKNMTLLMNWKAQKDEALWKYSYNAYSKLHAMKISDYFSGDYTSKQKRESFLNALPVGLSFKIFKWRYER